MKNIYAKYLSGIINEEQFYEIQERILNESYDTSKIRLNFGKHSGKTLEEIEREDPSYLRFIHAKNDPKSDQFEGGYIQPHFIKNAINHHIKKSEMENGIHNKIFIAKVKKSFTTQNFMEKNLQKKEGKSEEKTDVFAHHSTSELNIKKTIKFEKDDVVIIKKNSLVKIDIGYKCEKCKKEFGIDSEYGYFKVPENRKCTRTYDDTGSGGRICKGNILHEGYGFRFLGFSDDQFLLKHEESKKSNGFAILKLGDPHSKIALITDEIAQENLETIKVPGTQKQVFGYSIIQTMAFANKYGLIDIDNHKDNKTLYKFDTTHEDNSIPHYEMTHGVHHIDKSHIVSMPYKDPEFAISRKYLNNYSIDRQITQEWHIALDLYAALHGNSRINHSREVIRRKKNPRDPSPWEAERDYNSAMKPIYYNFNNEINNRSIDPEIETKIANLDKSKPEVQKFIRLSKICSYIKENGGPDAAQRSNAVINKALEEITKEQP
jgi:hypothetical protein